MALSFCSNWDAMEQHLTSNLGQFYDPQSELADALIGLYDPIDLPIDSLFDQPPPLPDDLFPHAEPTNSVTNTSSLLLPSYSDPSIISLPAEQYPLAPVDDFDYCRCPKRPRSCSDLYRPSDVMFERNSYNAGLVGPSGWHPAEKKTGGANLSAQSVAARERRKRISEKTQELGRLIPGGNKMNTAEMFQAAFKYVKFLQAQVGIFSLMCSMQGGQSSIGVAEDMEILLKSQIIQEKLAVEEKCVVPKETVDALAKDPEIRSSPFISRELDRFVRSSNQGPN